jgi:ketosteroid isomerase-like protein
MGIKEAVLTTVDVSGAGDLAYEIGRFALKVQPEGKEVIEQKGKYVVVWKKAPNQVWKLHVDIWNSGPAVTKGS